MKNFKLAIKVVICALTFGLLVTNLTGCREINASSVPIPKEGIAYYFPIPIDQNTEIDQEYLKKMLILGKGVTFEPIKLPYDISDRKRLIKIHSFEIFRLDGSHYDIVYVNGVPYKIRLPH